MAKMLFHGVSLLAPGLHEKIKKEAAGMAVTILHAFDKVIVSSDSDRVTIPYDVLVRAARDDNYSEIDRTVVEAVRYLRIVDGKIRFVRRRAFRTKQRSILSRG